MTETEKKTGLTPEEAAEYLGCSEYTIKKLAREKAIKHYRVGNRIRFRKFSLDKWIEQQEKMCIPG